MGEIRREEDDPEIEGRVGDELGNENEGDFLETREESSPTESAVEISETQSVIAAEDIALARGEITQRIINENIPVEKWTETAEEVLKRYPQLEIYKDCFLKTIQKSQETNHLINQLWEENVSDKTADSEFKVYSMSNHQEADEKSSKIIFEKVVGEAAEGTVKVIRGRQSLIFELDEDDATKIWPEMKGSGGFFTHGAEVSVPVIILPSEQNKDHGDKLINLSHETQHLHNELLKSATDYIAFEISSINLQKGLRKAKRRNLWEELVSSQKAKKRAKNEILSFATNAEMAEYSIAFSKDQGDFSNSSEVIESEIKEFWENIKKDLTEGKYYEEYEKNGYFASPSSLENYKNTVNAAIDAYIRLTKTYKRGFSGRTNRMTIDVLAQFPLDKWPAVEHLIEMRRKSR